MSDAIGVALIAAFSSVVGSVLTFIVGIRSVRRSMSTSNGEPLGRVLEARLDRLERQLDGLDRAVGEVREWHRSPGGHRHRGRSDRRRD